VPKQMVVVDYRKCQPEKCDGGSGRGDGSMQGRIKRRQHLIEAFRLLFEAEKREKKIRSDYSK
jgi:hypothetical protein